MREIKFRQPCIANGKFQYWHFWGYVDGKYKGHFVAPLPPNTGGDSYQFAGLLDKNGKEIYEGDIVHGLIDEEEHSWGVAWETDDMLGWSIDKTNEPLEVIGNIHEGTKEQPHEH